MLDRVLKGVTNEEQDSAVQKDKNLRPR